MNVKNVTGLGGVVPLDQTGQKANAPAGNASNDRSSASGAPSTADQLSLTGVSQFLATAADGPAPVDSKRIDAIRNALQSGTYEIDADRLAAKLLSLDQDLV